MLGKVSVQPRVGQWKVLPGQRNSERDSAPAQLRTAPLLGPQHLPRSPHSHLLEHHHGPCLSSEPCSAPSHPKKGHAGCPGLTLEGLRGSVVDLQVVHQLLHAGEGQFAAVARALVVFPCKDTDPSGSSLPRLSLSPPRGGAGLTWDRSALQRPQLRGRSPCAPRHRGTGQGWVTAACGERV